MITELINRPVVILTRTDSDELDDAGDAIDTEAALETVAEIQPRTSDEPSGHPDIADTDWVGFFLPADVDALTSASLVWVPGMGDFKIVGSAMGWRSPFDRDEEYVEVGLNRVAGAGDSEGS